MSARVTMKNLLSAFGVAEAKEVSNLHDDRHDQRASLRLPGDISLQVGANFLFDHSVVGFLFGAGGIEGFDHNLLDAIDHAVFAGVESAGHNLGRSFHTPGELVHGDDRHHEAVFAEVATIFNNEVVDHIGARAGIDADTANIDASGLACAGLIDFENVSAFNQHHLADRSAHRPGQFGVQPELPVLAVNGNEVFRPHQINDELQFLLAAMS